jgi:hypothetical protein
MTAAALRLPSNGSTENPHAHFIRAFMTFDGKRLAIDKRAIGLISEDGKGTLGISLKLAGVKTVTVAGHFDDVVGWWLAAPPAPEISNVQDR